MNDDSTIAGINNSLLEFLRAEFSPSLRVERVLWDYEISPLVEFSNEFDRTGELTLIYLAAICRRQIACTMAPVEAMLFDSQVLDPFRLCKRLIESEIVKESRAFIVNRLAAIISSVSEQGLIGDSHAIDESLDNTTEAIFKSFSKLRFEVYLNSGRPIGDFSHFSPSVQVSGSLAEMLLRLEKAPDGIYVGYITNPGLDGWFGFFCKSCGNMFSYNERIDEAYVGQHHRLRNGRYAEDKAYDLFPYELVNFSDERDYKGYSLSMAIDDHHQLLDTNDFSIFIRAILSMALISQRHKGNPVNGETVIVNSLIASNLAKLNDAGAETTAIVKWEGSPIVKASAAFSSPVFDVAKVLRGDYNAEFNHGEGKNWRESGWFEGLNQDIVDVYGTGFSIDQERVCASNSSRRLIGDMQTEQEFVGTSQRMRLSAYYEVRKQLAKHILRKINDDFNNFGGLEALKKWVEEKAKEKIDKVLSYCLEAHKKSDGTTRDHIDFGEGEIQPGDSTFKAQNHALCVFFSNKPMYSEIWLSEREAYNHVICPITGAKASFFFKFFFSTYIQVRNFLECDLPKFCVGWREREWYNGNSILDVTDPVGDIRTPLSGTTPFSFEIGLSKSGLNELAKLYAEEKGGAE